MVELSQKEKTILAESIKELKDLEYSLNIEIATCDDYNIKATMFETKLKTRLAIVNLEKQRMNILPNQMV